MKVHVVFTCFACNVIGSGVLEIFADINKFDLLRRWIESILHIVLGDICERCQFFFHCGIITMNEYDEAVLFLVSLAFNFASFFLLSLAILCDVTCSPFNASNYEMASAKKVHEMKSIY